MNSDSQGRPLQQDALAALLISSVKDYGICMLDPEGRVISWNDGARRMLGYQGSEILGQHFSRFYTSQANPRDELEQALRHGRFEEEAWRVRQDGSRFWANVVIRPVYQEQRLVGFAKVIRDLSERKKHLKAREHLALMIASVRDYAIFMLDPDGIVITWNEGAQRIKGYAADEIIGRHFSTFYPAEARRINHPQNELDIARSQGQYEEEGWRVRKDGSLFWAHVLITALYEAGTLIGFAKVTRDLTERKNAEKAREKAYCQLAQANEELHSLAYTISHELQEPISSILSYSKLLASRYQERLGYDADEFLDRIKRGAMMTARLVDDLWTYARITRPGTVLNEVPMGRLWHETKAQLRELLDSRRVRLEEPGEEQWPQVKGIRDQLLYVLKELLTNAIEHNPGETPSVEVSLGWERNGWCFSFKDNGPGIDKFFAQQIFGLYQRLDRKPDETGTGMGLPICKKIIHDEHRGRIGFESLEGQGAKFFFWIPSAVD